MDRAINFDIEDSATEKAMSPYRKTILFSPFAFVIGALPIQAHACASCGCSVNTDWGAQGVSTGKGWTLDLRYDYLNQNQLRSGHGTIAPDAAVNTTNTQTLAPAEVEQYTKNQYTTATIDYNNGASWAVSLLLPYIQRSHSTYGSASDFGLTDGYPTGANGYDSSASGMGDIKLLGRYFGLLPSKNLGFQIGLKLATGKKDQTAIGHDGVTLVPVDPGLQLGTGTTDLIVGAYYSDNLNANWDYFTQAIYQTALNHSSMNMGDAMGTYKPGDSVNLNLGVRYHGFNAVTPMAQLNVRHVSHDTGDAADTYSTGGTLVYFTPGVIVPVSPKVSLYSNVQLPVYQDVRGIQLAPKYIFSLGVHASF